MTQFTPIQVFNRDAMLRLAFSVAALLCLASCASVTGESAPAALARANAAMGGES